MVYRYLLVILTLLTISCSSKEYQFEYAAGDLIFQSLPHGELVDTIEGSTNSPYSHVGILVEKENKFYVREALGNVQDTKLLEFLTRGRQQQHAVYRLKEQYKRHIPQLIAETQKYLGRPYDIRYRLDDEMIYCSELIYKAFKDATNLEMGRLVKLGTLNWQKYENFITQIEGGPVPIEREMITPKDLAQAEQLDKVYSNYEEE